MLPRRDGPAVALSAADFSRLTTRARATAPLLFLRSAFRSGLGRSTPHFCRAYRGRHKESAQTGKTSQTGTLSHPLYRVRIFALAVVGRLCGHAREPGRQISAPPPVKKHGRAIRPSAPGHGLDPWRSDFALLATVFSGTDHSFRSLAEKKRRHASDFFGRHGAMPPNWLQSASPCENSHIETARWRGAESLVVWSSFPHCGVWLD